MLWHKSKTSLVSWLIATSITQVVVSVALVGYICYRNGENIVYRYAQELMVQIGDRLVAKIDSYLETPNLINRLNYSSINMGELNTQDIEKIHRRLILLHQEFPTVTSILYGDEQGQLRTVHRVSPAEIDHNNFREIGFSNPDNPSQLNIFQADQQGNKKQYLQTLNNFDVRDRLWYKQARQKGELGWTEPIAIGETGVIAISCYQPIYENQKLIGVFAVNISLEEISKFLKEINPSKSGNIYIIDNQKRIIASSDSNLVSSLEKLPGENYYTRKIAPNNNSNKILQALNQSTPTKSPQQLNLTIDTEKYFVRIIPYGNKLGLNWYIVAMIPDSDLTEQNRANLLTTILLSAVSGAIALISSLFTARVIAIPLIKLQKITKTFEKTNSFSENVTTPIREINDLSIILAEMFQRMKTSESKLEQIVKYLPVGVVVLDSNGTINYINPHGMKLLDIDHIPEAKPSEHSQRYQLFRSHTNDFYPYAELPSIQALQGKYVYIDDLEIRVSNRVTPCEFYSSPIFDYQQQIIGCVNVFYDISDRQKAKTILAKYNQILEQRVKETTQALGKNQTLLERLLEKVPGNICAWTSYPNGNIEYQYINPIISKIFDISPETLAQNPNIISELVHVQDRFRYQQALKHSSSTLEVFDEEWRIVNLSGKIKWLQGILQPELGDNGAIHWYGVILDITSRKKAEAELKESEEKFRSCFNDVSTGMVIVNLHGYFLRVNPAFCQIMGYSHIELLNMSFRQITHPDDLENSLKFYEQMLRGEINNFQVEKRYVNKSGQIIYAITNVSLVKNSENVPLYCVAQIQDISDRHRAQIELEKANLAKTQFIGNMSHELRTPLNIILGFTQLLLDQSVEQENYSRLRSILDNGNHLLSLINNLLTLSEIETGNINIQNSQVNLSQLLTHLHNSYTLQAQQKNLQLIWCVDKSLPDYLETDLVKLRQIMINILDNALKFTDTGTITFIATHENNHLLFKIEDTGSGIDPAEIKDIFKPFIQTTTGKKLKKGTGLGLSVTKTLIELLQGEITVNSQPEKGTFFTIKIPINNLSTKLDNKNDMSIDCGFCSPSEYNLTEIPDNWLKKFQQNLFEGDVNLMLESIEEIRLLNETFANYLIHLVKSFRLREVLLLISKDDPNQ